MENINMNEENFFEKLFWKVFHNKYIVRQIMNQMEYQVIEYENMNSYYSGNRIKFKHLLSLKWFLDNKQMELLKYKLKIKFNHQQQQQQLNNGSDDSGSNNTDNMKMIDDCNIIVDYLSVNSFFKFCHDGELIKLFYQIYQKEITDLHMHDDVLVMYGVETQNMDTLETLLIDLSLKCDLHSLNLAISKHKTHIIQILMDHCTDFALEHFKDFGLNWANENKRIGGGNMVLYILDNYYHLLEQSDIFLTNPLANNIKVDDFLQLKSQELQLSLLKRKKVYKEKKFDKLYYLGKQDFNIQELKLYILVAFWLFNSNVQDRNEIEDKEFVKEIEEINENESIQDTEKRLFQILIVKFNYQLEDTFYKKYLIKYGLVIEDKSLYGHNDTRNVNIIYEYTFKSFNINTLNWLISYCNDNPDMVPIDAMKSRITFNSEQSELIIPFMQMYFSQEVDIVKYQEWGSLIRDILESNEIQLLESILSSSVQKQVESILLSFEISNLSGSTSYNLSINSFSTYKWFIESIVLKHIKESSKFKHYNEIIFEIDNDEKIQFLESNKDFYQLGFGMKQNNEFNKLLLANQSKRFNHIYGTSILNCNLDSIKFINNLNLDFNLFQFYNPFNNNLYNDGTKFNISSIDLVIQLFQIENKLNFKGWSCNYFKSVFGKLVNSFPHDEIYESFSKHSFDFNSFQSFLMEFLFDQIQLANIPLIKLVLENCKFNIQHFTNYYSTRVIPYLVLDKHTWKLDIDTININSIISTIEYLFSKLNGVQSSLSNLFNLLYNRMLVTKGCTIEQVLTMNKLYESNGISITSSTFRIFCWLNIKSTRLTKYVLSKPSIDKHLYFTFYINQLVSDNININANSSYNPMQLHPQVHQQQQLQNYTKLFKIIDSYYNVFTIDIIANEEFSQLFSLLKLQFSTQFSKTVTTLNKNDKSKIIEEDLSFLLIVNELDLLFSTLNQHPDKQLFTKKFKEKLFKCHNVETIDQLKRKYNVD